MSSTTESDEERIERVDQLSKIWQRIVGTSVWSAAVLAPIVGLGGYGIGVVLLLLIAGVVLLIAFLLMVGFMA